MMSNLQLRYSMDPWQVLTPEQNFTFFVPTNEAWRKVRTRFILLEHSCSFQQAPSLVARMNDGNHWQALQYVYKRHVVQGLVSGNSKRSCADKMDSGSDVHGSS